MADNTIITAEEFAEFRPDISKGWEKEREKIERCIQDAEQVDLFEKLGPFYFDVKTNSDSEDWSELMDGNDEHIGLKRYIAGLAYVRYLGQANMTHTPHGYVNKLTQNSEPVPYNQIKDEKKEEQRSLAIRFITIDNYLRSNPVLFANYKPQYLGNINYNNVKTNTLR